MYTVTPEGEKSTQLPGREMTPRQRAGAVLPLRSRSAFITMGRTCNVALQSGRKLHFRNSFNHNFNRNFKGKSLEMHTMNILT